MIQIPKGRDSEWEFLLEAEPEEHPRFLTVTEKISALAHISSARTLLRYPLDPVFTPVFSGGILEPFAFWTPGDSITGTSRLPPMSLWVRIFLEITEGKEKSSRVPIKYPVLPLGQAILYRIGPLP